MLKTSVGEASIKALLNPHALVKLLKESQVDNQVTSMAFRSEKLREPAKTLFAPRAK